jgi:hypothetical protein
VTAQQEPVALFPTNEHGLQQPVDVVDPYFAVAEPRLALPQHVDQHLLLAIAQAPDLDHLRVDGLFGQIRLHAVHHPQGAVRTAAGPGPHEQHRPIPPSPCPRFAPRAQRPTDVVVVTQRAVVGTRDAVAARLGRGVLAPPTARG